MVEALVAVILVMIGLGTNGYIGISPEGLKEAGLASGPQPRCREYTPSEFQALGNKPKGKAATYSMDGEFICERTIFAYGERDSFYDFVASVAPARIVKAARSFALLQKTNTDMAADWAIRVISEDEPVRIFVADLVRSEFSGHAATGSITNQYADINSRAVIEIEVVRVQDQDLLLKPVALLQSGERKRRWNL
jgi:hypothetical protein